MSLLKRIESAHPGASTGSDSTLVPVPADGRPSGVPPAPTASGGRLGPQGPSRESFRDVKFRVQSRVIRELVV